MSLRARWLALSLLACDPAPAAPAPGPADACAATSPVRLAAPPAGWRPEATYQYRFRLLGDRIAYTFDPPDLPDRTFYTIDRCGGAPARLPLPPGSELAGLQLLDTADGPVLYARDAAGVQHLVDRLDVPGDDPPRPVTGLPPGLPANVHPGFVLFAGVSEHGTVSGAAGFGDAAYHFSFYTHAGDPDRPAVHLGDDIVDYAFMGDRMLLLHEDGALRDIDPRTGDGEPLLTGVRAIDLSFDDRRLVWQALGDDLAEPVHLLDLDTGDDREIAVNEFTAQSWGRDPAQAGSVGTWFFTLDSGVAVMIGPDARLVAAVRTDTGEALPIPEHTAWQSASGDDALILRLSLDGQPAEAAWTPRSGGLRVFYRGPADPRLRFNDGARLEYFLPDPADPEFGALHRVDLASGRSVRLAPRVGEGSRRLGDGRYLAVARTGFIYTAEGVYFAHDLDLFDPNTQVYFPLAAAVDDWTLVRDQGVFYVDARGPEPGLWLHPLPDE